MDWATAVLFFLIGIIGTTLAIANHTDTFAGIILGAIGAIGLGGGIAFYRIIKNQNDEQNK